MLYFISPFQQLLASFQKKLIKFLILFCFQSNWVTAQDSAVWVKSVYSSYPEFLVFIESSNSASYADYLIRQQRKQAKNFKLKEQLLKAQELFLSGEDKRAVQAFRGISSLAYRADWDEEDRRIIMYSLLRLAQFEEEPEQRKALLLSASDFFIFEINEETYSDYSLFPPPLIEELKEIQKKKNILSLNWTKIFPNHEIILLNGQKLEKYKIPSLPQAVYRITALSSSHKTWGKNISLSKLARQIIETASLTTGTCQKLKLLIQKKNIKLAPVSNCPNLNPLSSKMENNLAFSPIYSEKESKSNTEKTETTARQWPSWLIVGVSVVALSLIISLGGNKDKSQNDQDDFVY